MEFSEVTTSAIEFVIKLLPIILPLVLLRILFVMWVNYARSKFLSQQEYKLLRIYPPREVLKSPAAMELFMNSFYQTTGEANPIQVYVDGSVRPWFSLELVSNGGDVGFYIWTRSNSAEYLSNQIYAQYPGIEVQEVEDYTKQVDLDSGAYKIWATELQLTEPDPIPIKTYVDYKLDQTATEEESKIDPISSALEFLGSIKNGEYVWIQIIIRAHKKEDKDPNSWFGLTDLWKDTAQDIVKQIREKSFVEVENGDYKSKVPMLSKIQDEKINAIERSLSKPPFDTGIRAIYVAEKDLFDGVNIGGMIGSFRQYSSASLNGFKPGLKTGFDYWWQDPFGTKDEFKKKEFFEAYCAREYFFRPFLGSNRKHFVLNSEELATIFHFPGSVVATPTLQRVQSKKSEAPNDLPI